MRHGKGDALLRADVDLATNLHRGIFDQDARPGDRVTGLQFRFQRQAKDVSRCRIDGDLPVVACHLVKRLHSLTVGVRDAAVIHLVMRLFLRHIIVEDRYEPTGALLPVAPDQLVLGCI